MVVVPPFAQAEQCDPPEIGGVIPGRVTPVAPQVGRAVDQPGCMIEQRGADKNPPNEPGQPYAAPGLAQREEQARKRQGQEDVAALEEAVYRHLGQVNDVTLVAGGVIKGRDVRHPPQQVRPPDTVPWAVGIALRVAVLMMNAVNRYPLQRPSLVGQGTQDRQDVFHELGRPETPVGEQPMVTHSQAEPRGQVEG